VAEVREVEVEDAQTSCMIILADSFVGLTKIYTRILVFTLQIKPVKDMHLISNTKQREET
jgi:hypothetical protein